MSNASVMFQSPDQINRKIVVGMFALIIMAISSAAGSFYYWAATTNILNPDYMDKQSVAAKVLLYSMMLLAFSIELGKFLMHSIYYDKKLFWYAVTLSLLTSIGGTAILNHNNLNALRLGSADHQANVKAVEEAKANRALYARCATFNTDASVALLELNSNVPKRSNGKKDWGAYNIAKDKITKDAECAINYQNADAAVKLAEADANGTKTGASGGNDVSTNPLMKFLGKLIGQGEEAATMMFFIFTMLGIELMSQAISYQRQKLINDKELTATQLQAITLKETTGFDLIGAMGDAANAKIQREFAIEAAQQDILLLRKAFSKKIKQRVKDYDKMSMAELKNSMQGVNTMDLNKKPDVIVPPAPTQTAQSVPVQESPADVTSSHGDLKGMTLDQVEARRKEYKAKPLGQRLCPYCSAKVPVASGTYYCNADHQTQFNGVVKSLKRMGSGATVQG